MEHHEQNVKVDTNYDYIETDTRYKVVKPAEQEQLYEIPEGLLPEYNHEKNNVRQQTEDKAPKTLPKPKVSMKPPWKNAPKSSSDEIYTNITALHDGGKRETSQSGSDRQYTSICNRDEQQETLCSATQNERGKVMEMKMQGENQYMSLCTSTMNSSGAAQLNAKSSISTGIYMPLLKQKQKLQQNSESTEYENISY